MVGAARVWDTAMSDAAAGVFISYRRQEASWLAAWLHDRLVAQFGEARVFLDIDWIKPGVNFMQVITEAIAGPGSFW
jgi:TIR domain